MQGEDVSILRMAPTLGCTTIHFLYSSALKGCEGLGSSLQVYCVAQKYNIYGLAQLAEEQADRFVHESPASRMLEIIQEASESFTGDDGWFDELILILIIELYIKVEYS
jgi:hypothetical protein